MTGAELQAIIARHARAVGEFTPQRGDTIHDGDPRYQRQQRAMASLGWDAVPALVAEVYRLVNLLADAAGEDCTYLESAWTHCFWCEADEALCLGPRRSDDARPPTIIKHEASCTWLRVQAELGRGVPPFSVGECRHEVRA